MLVVISIVAIILSLLTPAIEHARDTAFQLQSLTNLRQISTGLTAYAGDWNDRQPTLIPDDFCQSEGSVGNPSWYSANVGRLPDPILGWGELENTPTLFAYWIQLDDQRGGFEFKNPRHSHLQVANFRVALPYDCQTQIGFFRQPNMQVFSQYLNNRYYDPVFYAPKDRRKTRRIKSYFNDPHEFCFDDPDGDGKAVIEWSSYCFAASAMFNPNIWDPVRRGRGSGSVHDTASAPCLRNEGGGPAGLKSPRVSKAVYPDLKTRMLEHEWLQNAPGDTNPLFDSHDEPYYFNQGIHSSPCTLFYDGSVRLMGVQEVVESNQRLVHSNESQSLWCHDWGGKNYFEEQGYGFENERTSYHVMTRFGIEGRDTIGQK